MNQLPPHLAELIEAARSAHDPSPADAQRVHAALMGSLSSGTAIPQGTGEASGTATTAASSSLLGKLLIVGALVGGTVGGLTWVRHTRGPEANSATVEARGVVPEAAPHAQPASDHGSVALRAQAPNHARPSARIETAHPEHAEVVDPGRAPHLGYTAPRGTPSAPQTRAVLSASRVGRGPASAPTQTGPAERAAMIPPPRPEIPVPERREAEKAAPESTVSTRREELSLIRATLTALRDGRPQRALDLLKLHEARFQRGMLAHERRGLRVVALCALGDLASGRREQAAFLEQDAQSPLAQRVRGACSAESP